MQLQDTTIIAALQRDYGFEQPEITLLKEAYADNETQTYRVSTAVEPYILRIYGGAWAKSWIEFELALLADLSDRHVPVSTPLPAHDGSVLGTIWAAERPYRYSLFTFAEGRAQWPLDPALSYDLGATLAKLHDASNNFMTPHKAKRYDVAHMVDRPLSQMLPFLAEHPEEAAHLQRLAQQIKAYIAQLPSDAPYYGTIHGDIHQGNCHFAEDGTLTLFDFAFCGIGWRVFDFTGFLWPMRDETIEKEAERRACEAFLEGYQSVRTLHPAEVAAIPAFVKVRDLWETANWLEGAPGMSEEKIAKIIVGLVHRFQTRPLPGDSTETEVSVVHQ